MHLQYPLLDSSHAVNIIVLMYVIDKLYHKNITYRKEFGYCPFVCQKQSGTILSALLLSLPDALCVGLMLWTSSTILQAQAGMQHVHKKNIAHRYSAESRATKTIILFISTFVYFYTLASNSQAFFTLYSNPNKILLNAAAVVTRGNPTVSTFLLMNNYTNISRIHLVCARKKISFKFMSSTFLS